jgi:hypothetical protein
VRRIQEAIGRPVTVVTTNTARSSSDAVTRCAAEHEPPLEVGDIPKGCDLVEGESWSRDIARHHRRRVAYAVWTALARRLLT